MLSWACLEIVPAKTRALVYSDPFSASLGLFIRNRTRASPSYGTVLRNPAISTTVPFQEEISEVEINFRAMAEDFTAQDEKILFVRNEEIREKYCRMCFQCKGKCPKGVPVADELRMLAYYDFAGDFNRARENFWQLPRNIRNIQCRDCSTCAIQCPNGVRVHDRLIRAQELLA